jgi:hypothetical protein
MLATLGAIATLVNMSVTLEHTSQAEGPQQQHKCSLLAPQNDTWAYVAHLSFVDTALPATAESVLSVFLLWAAAPARAPALRAPPAAVTRRERAQSPLNQEFRSDVRPKTRARKINRRYTSKSNAH